MDLSEANIDRNLLSKLTPEKRKLIILLGHITNELHVFNKLLMASIAALDENYNKCEDAVQAGQSFILIRDLIGKLHEARRVFQVCAQSVPEIQQDLKSKLSQKGLKQARRLNKLFNDGVIADIRNSFSFHYLDKYELLAESFTELPDEEPLRLYLSTYAGNSFYHYSEVIVQYAVLRQVCLPFSGESNKQWLKRSFGHLCRLVTSCLSLTLELFNEVLKILLPRSVFERSPERIEVQAHPKSQARLPFFMDIAN